MLRSVQSADVTCPLVDGKVGPVLELVPLLRLFVGVGRLVYDVDFESCALIIARHYRGTSNARFCSLWLH